MSENNGNDTFLPVIRWKLCSQCPRREENILKHSGGMFMGYYVCGLIDREGSETTWAYVYPNIDRENRPLPNDCPFYAEAVVEQLNED